MLGRHLLDVPSSEKVLGEEGKLAQEERCYFAGNLYHLMKMIGRIDALFFSFLLHLTWIITIPTPFQHCKLPQ